MKNIKSIDIVFENCESIVIPMDRILKYEFGKFESLNGDPWERNAYRTDLMHIQISYSSEEELEYVPFWTDEPLGMFIDNPTSNDVQDRPNILGRILNHRDIVCIDEFDENENKIRCIYGPWPRDEEYDNYYMNVVAENGILDIKIQK